MRLLPRPIFTIVLLSTGRHLLCSGITRVAGAHVGASFQYWRERHPLRAAERCQLHPSSQTNKWSGPPSNQRRRATTDGGGRTTALAATEPLRTIVDSNLHADEQTIKKSRFIGFATHCTSWDDAKSIIEEIRKEHPKSRHACFGFVSGTERCSDDGEPTGTAGSPILGAIHGDGLSDTLCVVVRYSGGIKLGAGGLIRAYGGTARLALRSAPTEVRIPKSTVRISTRTANSGAVYASASKFGGKTGGEGYNDRGELELSIVCDEKDEAALREDLMDATRGAVMFL